MKKINVLLWSKIFRKSLIDKYKIRFPNGCLHDDDAFVFQYLLVTRKVFLLPEKLYNYFRREKDSIMANDYTYSSTSTDRCQIGHFCYEWMVKNHLFPARRNDFYRFYFSQFRICFIRLRPDLRSDCLENESLFLKTQVAYLKNRATDFKIHRKMMEIFKKEMLRIERRFSISSPESLWCLKKKFWTQLILCVCTLGLLRGFRKKVVRLQEKIQRMSVELTQEKK